MKKLLPIGLLVIAGFLFPSCNDTDNNKQNDPNPSQPNIQGKWYTTSIETKRWDNWGNLIENSKVNPYPDHFYTFINPSHFREGAPNISGSKGSGTFNHFDEGLYLEILMPDLLYSRYYVIDSLTNDRLVMHTTVSTSPSDVKAITFRAKKE